MRRERTPRDDDEDEPDVSLRDRMTRLDGELVEAREVLERVAPGELRMVDPVGTPEKRGFEECCAKPFDLFQPRVQFRIQPGTLFVCGNEVAWLLENHMTVDGETSVQHSIETYRFGEDGSCTVRTWYRVPERSESELGEMFDEYLPER